ncbi:hypothetical protein GCM10011507_09680 [Edaphobacter acidisoli]|uniref:CobQ/CobB/MinD/ParA nucleotide binding domain-containing protein n=1 Tax=Edaphobacter acidisoli TaxID=2040573 RepID=A0A916RKL4_9BACT|nr:cellulose synthase operon protein YhjQ/BcsQ [Edaphobacter acidisoli]GGA60180.1 hypothetical protein GCM10011507_09680 [Edaphobacter acidisoli]
MKDSQDTDKIEAQEGAQPPEDVAVLYSWANMHGARYRDFSDSRREHRAQLRQRAAEQLHGPAAANVEGDTEASRQHGPHDAGQDVRVAASNAVVPADQEIAEARAAAQRQAERYVDAERFRSVPVQSHPSLEEVRPGRSRRAGDFTAEQERQGSRRPQGYRPDDASGVREIYRGAELGAIADDAVRVERERRAPQAARQEITPASASMYPDRPSAVIFKTPPGAGPRRGDSPIQERRVQRQEMELPAQFANADPGFAARRDDLAQQAALAAQQREGDFAGSSEQAGSVLAPRGRRAQDDFDYKQAVPGSEPVRRAVPEPLSEPNYSTQRAQFAPEPAGPAWLYAPPSPQAAVKPKPVPAPAPPVQPSVAETLQHSRERVASRWFALKGVFEQPGQELPEAIPVRQKETRTPVLAVFSLAGGVGKTSMVATVGRALSSLGEKVLLTDTTSHGLLPFYFGASELRPDTVRTFSPPSGSTDAPIYLVSHDIEQKGSDDAAQEALADEIVNNSRGTQRILLDLTSSSGWIVKRLARMSPTVLVPLAPDMNSVISLQAVERYFQGVANVDGRPLQPYYVLNQFDSSLPLHLDVREVLRRQLGDRLLPFVIRQSPVVSEALAEGMTVVDYAPDVPVAEDYRNLATWLRGVAAPATAGFRNVRWSER